MMESPNQVAERAVRISDNWIQMERCDLPGTPENIFVTRTTGALDVIETCRRMQRSLAALILQQREEAVAEFMAEMPALAALLSRKAKPPSPALKMCMRLEYVQGDLFPKIWFEASEAEGERPK